MSDESLKHFVANLTQSPGIYRMLDATGELLYVGKATNLKKRVASYFNPSNQSPKTRALVQQISKIEVQITRSETEALLLESALIKQFRPKYNILLRDDKTYPFIFIDTTHPFPRIEVKRSKHKPKLGQVFGPYPSQAAAYDAVNMIQKVFLVRNCRDGYYNQRTRPCLQYQIKRCSAPCTGYINQDDYSKAIEGAKAFLQGKCLEVIESLEQAMQEAVAQLHFEEAAVLRDKIKALRLAQESQGISMQKGDLDVVGVYASPGVSCIQWVVVRDGEVVHHQHYIPKLPSVELEADSALQTEIFLAFVRHYYLEFQDRIPPLILTNVDLIQHQSIEAMLSEQRGALVKIQNKPRARNALWLDFAMKNLHHNVLAHQTALSTILARYEALSSWLKSETPISKMECFDISHTQGQDTVASCVVFNETGPLKRAYRTYKISNITPGDDYAAMAEVLRRRYKDSAPEQWPHLILIDGGRGQVDRAKSVLDTLGIVGPILLGISKGVTRKAGWEQLVFPHSTVPMTLPENSPALHLLQQIRDEAHRFAISSHRKRRQKSTKRSGLLEIEGLGAVRKKALLTRFGGMRELAGASVAEIAKVKGISLKLAEKIHRYFHP